MKKFIILVESLLFVFMILAFLSYYEITNKDKTEIKEELTLYELQYEKGETIYLAIGKFYYFRKHEDKYRPTI